MKRKILFIVISSFMLSAATKAQSGNLFSQLNRAEFPANPQQPYMQMHKPSSSPGYKQVSLAVVPLYDSIVISQPRYNPGFYSKMCNFVYDAKNNVLSETYQQWSGSAWVDSYLYTYIYNANNLKTSETDQSWNGNTWVNQSRTFYYYNANNIDTNVINQTWNGNTWVNSTQYISTYNANHLRTNYLYQTWTGGVWVNVSQYYSVYNAMNLDTNDIYKTWNGNGFINNSQYFYTYNANKSETTWLQQNWTNNAWVNVYTDTNFYNANNLDTSWVQESWSNNRWGVDMEGTYSYNGDGDTTNKEELAWISNSWMNVSDHTYTYDSNNIMVEDYWNYIASGSQTEITKYYYHLSGPTGVSEIKSSGNISMYPNPNNGVFTIQPSSDISQSLIEIYNELGQKVYQNQITDFNAPLTLSLMVPKGVYMVVLQNDQGVTTKKIIIQ